MAATAEGSADPSRQTADLSRLSAHAMALLTQARRAARGQAPDLDPAVAALRAAIAAHADEPVEQAMSMSNLALVLRERYLLHGDEHDLDEGVELLRIADRIAPADHPSRARTLTNLALLLFHRYYARRDPGNAVGAREAARAVALMTSAPPWIRVQAARQWGTWAALDSRLGPGGGRLRSRPLHPASGHAERAGTDRCRVPSHSPPRPGLRCCRLRPAAGRPGCAGADPGNPRDGPGRAARTELGRARRSRRGPRTGQYARARRGRRPGRSGQRQRLPLRCPHPHARRHPDPAAARPQRVRGH